MLLMWPFVQGGRLDFIVGKHGVDAVRNSIDQRFPALGSVARLPTLGKSMRHLFPRLYNYRAKDL